MISGKKYYCSLQSGRWTLLNITIFFLSTGLFTSCAAQVTSNQLHGDWHIIFTHKDVGTARTLMSFETDGKAFTAFTRKNADRDILGSWTSFLGRTFTSSLKGGSILNIEKGAFSMTDDTLHLVGILVTPMGHYTIEGFVARNQLHVIIRNKLQEQIGSIAGNRIIPDLPMEDYPALFQKAIALTAAKIYDQRVLQSKEWKHFEKNMYQTAPKLQDDLEMVFAFFYNASKLPFSHYALLKLPANHETTTIPNTGNVLLEEKSAATAYLKIRSFSGSASEMDSIFAEIIRKDYKNLIVDLRNNPGGSIEAGMAFATSVVDTTLYGGIFLTQKWFNQNNRLPTTEEYLHFPHFTAANFDLIIEGIHNTQGLCLKIVPKRKVYKGNLYLLINSRTASTCEPIAYELKKSKRAVIVGERTAGAMLNGEVFDLDKGFNMIIPTADYYTSDGVKIDKTGVQANITTKKQDALAVVLNQLDQ